MSTKIFVNLPVKDLNRSITFFSKLGFTFNSQFTDENSTCMIVADDIFVMLLVERSFRRFTQKQIADAHKTTEVLIALSTDGRPQVDELVDKALAAGAIKNNEPQDHGFMYSRNFQDPDGHIWEVLYMDPSFINK